MQVGNNIYTKEINGIKQYNVYLGLGTINNNSSWEPGNVTPILLGSAVGLKKIKLVAMVYGESRSEIRSKTQKFLTEFINPVELTLEGFKHHFKVVLDNVTVKEESMDRYHSVTLDLVGYEFGDDNGITYVTDVSHQLAPDPKISTRDSAVFHVNTYGTLPSPLNIKIDGYQGFGCLQCVEVYIDDNLIVQMYPQSSDVQSRAYLNVDFFNDYAISQGGVYMSPAEANVNNNCKINLARQPIMPSKKDVKIEIVTYMGSSATRVDLRPIDFMIRHVPIYF